MPFPRYLLATFSHLEEKHFSLPNRVTEYIRILFLMMEGGTESLLCVSDDLMPELFQNFPQAGECWECQDCKIFPLYCPFASLTQKFIVCQVLGKVYNPKCGYSAVFSWCLNQLLLENLSQRNMQTLYMSTWGFSTHVPGPRCSVSCVILPSVNGSKEA